VLNPAYQFLYEPARYKIGYGGRGAGKSWEFARALIRLADSAHVRILCAREYQTSINDSVYRLLIDQIHEMELQDRFHITNNSIASNINDSLFLFKGLRRNIWEIKSTEGVDICWVEEGQMVSNESWSILIPTIRKSGSEIWVSFNTGEEEDPTYQRFVINTPPDSIVKKINYDQNPFFEQTELKAEMEYLKQCDYEAYLHVWEGEPKKISEAVIFGGKYEVRDFETPENARFFHGVDWGFSSDPTAAIRMYEEEIEGCLYLFIDREAYGLHVDTDDLPQFFDNQIETLRAWPSYADNARPETISYMNNRKRGFFKMKACRKWKGSVEDGIAFLRGNYKKIIIHSRCKNTAQEFKLYSYKVDEKTQEVLPVIVDKHNHCIDAIRYGLDKKIKPGKKTFLGS